MTDDSSTRPDEAVETPDTPVDAPVDVPVDAPGDTPASPDAADDGGVVSRVGSQLSPLVETTRSAFASRAGSVRGRLVGAEDKPTPLALALAGGLFVATLGALLRRRRRSRR